MMMIIVVVVSTVLGMILSATAGYYICQLRKAKLKAAQEENSFYKDSKEESQDNELELPLFDLGTILAATNKFSSGNKIGQGGFGSVYKVILHYTTFRAEESSILLYKTHNSLGVNVYIRTFLFLK